MADFEQALAVLRGLGNPCAPPIGVGEFDVLYASAREVVVWYSPVREGHHAGEVAIPCARLAAAWAALTGGATLDEAALTELGASIAGGRWLLALLALLPGARVQAEPLALTWSPRAAARAMRATRATRQPGKPGKPRIARQAGGKPRIARTAGGTTRASAAPAIVAAERTGTPSRSQPQAAQAVARIRRQPGA